MGDVHRLQVNRRLRIARPLTVRQSIEGIVADLERLPQHPDPVDVRTIAERLNTLANRLERDGWPGMHRET